MPTADYDAGCRVRSTSTKCPTRKSRTSSSPPISRPENALASRLLFRQFSKSLAKTCKSGSRKALLHSALESSVYLQARMEEAAECMLVLIGATPEGKKELVGFQTGVREGAQSWRELLIDIKKRGLAIAPDL